MPTVGPPKQFYTKSPGLDRSVVIPETDWMNQLMLVACIIILTALILGFLFMIYKKTVTNHQAYEQMHRSEKSRGMQPLKKMKAAAARSSAQPADKQNLMDEEVSPSTNYHEEYDASADDGYL